MLLQPYISYLDPTLGLSPAHLFCDASPPPRLPASPPARDFSLTEHDHVIYPFVLTVIQSDACPVQITRRYVLLVHSARVLFINRSYSSISLNFGNNRKGRLLHKEYQQCSNYLALPVRGAVWPGIGVSIVHCTRASPCYVALRNARFNVFDFRVIKTTKHYYYVIMFKWNMFLSLRSLCGARGGSARRTPPSGRRCFLNTHSKW